jgi:hypothetical protein
LIAFSSFIFLPFLKATKVASGKLILAVSRRTEIFSKSEDFQAI